MEKQMEQPKGDVIEMICKAVKYRVKELSLKGKKRDQETVTFVAGYTLALADQGLDVSAISAWLAYDLSFRGYSAIERAAEKGGK